MANTIDLCPQCRGKLVPISERTGGFSGTKAVAGAVLAGPVGVAAGAMGKRLITLQCEKCGYTIETDAQTAQEAAAFGEAFERYCSYRNAQKLQKPDLLRNYGYSDAACHAFEFLGVVHRTEERKKIGFSDQEIEAIEADVQKVKQRYEQEKKILETELTTKKEEKDAKNKRLQTLGFFKFSEKKALQGEIAALEEVISTLQGQIVHCMENCKKEVAPINSQLLDRCRVLAYAWMERYAPEEYKELLRVVYSFLNEEPQNFLKIHGEHKELFSNLTPLQIGLYFGSFYNPFISYNDPSYPTASMTCGFYFGADVKIADKIRKRAIKPYRDGDEYTVEMIDSALNYAPDWFR